jgi:DNA replication protein DnaC
MTMSREERINSYFKALSLPAMRNNFKAEAENATKAKLSYQDFLVRLLELEVAAQHDRSVNRRIQMAGFPAIKRLEEFDFSYQPQLDEKLIYELASLAFLDDAKNILLLGAPGVGKTHLAIALGIKACIQERRVMFFSAEHLTQQLAAAEVSGTLPKYLQVLARAELIIIDELGYLELTKKTATLFFQLIAKRYEKGSIIVTSNKPFEQWGQIFQDDIVASAILDRLLHHSYPFFIQGKSFRMKELLGEKKQSRSPKDEDPY